MGKGVSPDGAGPSPTVEPPRVSPAAAASIPDAEEIDRYWMKEPCGPCPFSRSKTLPLHPERAEDFAYMAQNRYNDFVCHKTAELFEDDDGSGEFVRGERSFTCNGFLSLQVNEGATPDDGFEPHPDAFGCADEMIEHHADLWEQRHAKVDGRRMAETGTGSGRSPTSAVGDSRFAQPSPPESGAIS